MLLLTQTVMGLSVFFLCSKYVLCIPATMKTTAFVPRQPVVVEIPTNASVNVLVKQNPPIILSASRVVTPSTVDSRNQSTTNISSTTLTSQSTTPTPSIVGNGTSARFSNSQSYLPVMMLPLGSEGPNANRTVNVVPSPQASVLLTRQPIISRNRRVEISLIDFQKNRTGAPRQTINQNITISVKFIAGSVPKLAANEDLEVVQNVGSALQATIFHGNTSDSMHPNTTIVPQSTSGFQQVFDGTYQSDANENKVAVQRIITAELCGQLTQFDRGYLEVSIKPSPDVSIEDKQFEGYFKCVVYLNYTAAGQESNAYWSDISQCDSGNLSSFSYRLWLKTRQYSIDSATCQDNLPILDEHN